jgi:hypothetical protein
MLCMYVCISVCVSVRACINNNAYMLPCQSKLSRTCADNAQCRMVNATHGHATMRQSESRHEHWCECDTGSLRKRKPELLRTGGSVAGTTK